MKPMEPLKPMQPMEPLKAFANAEDKRWWPENLGDSPNSTGGQNEMRYAYFADKQRLAIDEGDGKTVIYDTDGRSISGVQQRQTAGDKKIVFTGEDGEMELATLKKL